VTVGANPWGQVDLVHANRGPIFAKDGRVQRDWDPLFRFPIFKYTIDAGFQDFEGKPHKSPEDVFSGKFLLTLRRRFLRPILGRIFTAAEEKGKGVREKVEGIATEMSQELMYNSHKPDAGRTVMARKHQKQDIGVQKLEAQKEGRSERLEKLFMPPAPPPGAKLK
jgi:hypothetical protein